MRKYYAFFFVSGFCSLLYEIVWVRLSMAQFGVTTPLVSMVLSFFMAGLGLGSWSAGKWLRVKGAGMAVPRLRFYGAVELLIGLSALIVPIELAWGHDLLLRVGGAATFSSAGYHVIAGACLLVTLLPWCACMGATFAFGMFALEGERPDQSPRAFSYLYLANVLGATAGAAGSLVLIELRGFTGALVVGALMNLALALVVFFLAARRPLNPVPASATIDAAEPLLASRATLARGLLFTTGLTSMGLEVTWIRTFTPYVGTLVYSFAAVLAIYLTATWLGTHFYRRNKARDFTDSRIWLLLAGGALAPLLTADPNLPLHLPHAGFVRLFLGVVPFSIACGYVTPMLVDQQSRGNPTAAASAYTINILGCIAGPLVAGFVLLPAFGERVSLMVLAASWFLASIAFAQLVPSSTPVSAGRRWMPWAVLTAAVLLAAVSTDSGSQYAGARVLRDHTATVIATTKRSQKRLLVNGVGITSLTPVTKIMAHLPMALHAPSPENVLVICFGMGTTHRAALSWGVRSTAVDLVPSVPQLFGYFHDDGPALLALPRSQIVIDDGRRYLERTQNRFDVITLDPPPPVEAAGSSLLYSREFYVLAKRRLDDRGLLQQWLPGGDDATIKAVGLAFRESFPYARVFRSLEGWGYHFLGSMQPIPPLTSAELASRLPPAAARDLIEWGPDTSAESQFARVLSQEITFEQIGAASPESGALTDDRPVNEYYLLRRVFKRR